MTTRITEAEMADVVKDILKRRPNKSATFAELRELVPKHTKLSRSDRTASASRPAEKLWEQIVRNLVAHDREGFEGVRAGVCLAGYAPKDEIKVKVKAKVAGKARKPARKPARRSARSSREGQRATA